MKTLLALLLVLSPVCWAEDRSPPSLTTLGTPSHAVFLPPQPRYLRIQCQKGSVSINMDTGAVTYENCTPDEGARAFWRAVEQMRGKE